MKQLILAEKPSVARDISKVLGANEKHKNYFEGPKVIVTWALGHLLGLKMPEDINQEWQTWQMETLPMIPKSFGIKPLPKTGGQLKAIKQLAQRNDVTEAIIATDAGREGELVARWILEYIRFNKPVKRLWISSQTDKAVKQGFNQLKSSKEYDNLYHSALARSQADWLVGLNVTRALTVKYSDNLSAGRVQTPTLALVRQQEKKIEGFKPLTYYTIDLQVGEEKGRMQLAKPQSLQDRNEAEALVKKISGKGKVKEIKEKLKSEPAPLPYDLTEAQRETNQRYGFSAKQTLSVIQNLYEVHKIVTYPRTDSKYLTADLKGTMKERLQAISPFYPEAKEALRNGSKVLQNRVFNDALVSDHFALIPTEQPPRFEKLSNEENKIYQLIVERFLGLFAENHQTAQKTITVAQGGEEFLFRQTTVVKAGWKRAAEEKQAKKMDWQEGMTVAGQLLINKELTVPPKPLTEGTLLAAMEKYSLGTPATRAEIIEKLVKSELMERSSNNLQVTPKGKQLLELVNPSLVTPDLTAKWEQELEKIAQGKASATQFIAGIEKDTKRLVTEIKDSKTVYQDFSLTQKKCPECGANLREKNTRDGKIYVCTNADCNYRRRKDPKVSNHRCPQCHRKMEIIDGKNGAYFRCKYDGTTEKMLGKNDKNKKMTKHEERRLMKKYSEAEEPQESALAQALKAAMKDKE